MKSYIGQPQMIKKLNKDLIKDIIKNNGPISKPEIAKVTKLSLATVNKIVELLVEDNIVRSVGEGDSTGGRRAQLYEIDGDSGYVIGLYFKNNYYICVVSNLAGEVTYRHKVTINIDSGKAALQDTFQAIDHLISVCGEEDKIKAIGIGVPGVVNNDGILSNIPTISEWEGINFKKILEDRYDVEFFIENDVNFTTVGIYHNQFKEMYKNIVYIYIGKGVGSGIIIDGRLYRGATNFAGELSHLIIENCIKHEDAELISKGSFESIVTYIIELITKEEIYEEKLRLKSCLIQIIARSLINIICLINPEAIVIDSESVDEEFKDKIEKEINKYIYLWNIPKIMYLSNCEDLSINGVINRCLLGIMSNFTLLNIKGV